LKTNFERNCQRYNAERAVAATFPDFLGLAANFGAGQTQSGPAPMGVSLLLVGVIGLLRMR